MIETTTPEIRLEDIKVISVVGRGAKGVVFFVRSGAGDIEDGDRDLALKAISRSSVENKAISVEENGGSKGGDAYRRIWFERDALLTLHHPLLPSLRGFVSTEKIVGFVIDRCSGGDLNSLRRRQTERMFSDDVIRFYAAELVLALEYLHGLGFVYRDLKPENVLIQDNGHIMLVDFDLSTKLPSPPIPSSPASASAGAGENLSTSKSPNSKPKRGGSGRLHRWFFCAAGVSPETTSPPSTSSARSSTSSSSAKSNSFVGTEEYVAPEIIEGSGHDFAVDWWGLGVVLYEMLYGRTPFRGQNRKETFYRILVKDPELTGDPNPLRDLIRKLLVKDPAKRVSGQEIKVHEFFRGVDWENVLRIGRPPFIPSPAVGEDWENEEGMDVEKTVEEVILAKEKKNENNFVEGLKNNVKNDNFEAF